MYKTLEVMGPEHEFSLVDSDLTALPIVDKVLKSFRGRIVNSVEQADFTFGKELQMHVLELRPNAPFKSAETFEENMQRAVLFVSDFLRKNYGARLLGTGMHPFMKLEETGVWPHRHQKIYEAYGRLFNLKQHGWLNIQSFQLNLSYRNGKDAVRMHNLLANVIPYLPAFTASSPIYDSKFGEYVDNRLHFYEVNQHEVPSITGDIIPEYVDSLGQYRTEIIEKYSSDMARLGADKLLLGKEWVNSRGVIFRFDRKALEIRVMDEQECIKSDVAISCFIRALLRGIFDEDLHLLPHDVLVEDFKSVVAEGLRATPNGRSARNVCAALYTVAFKNAEKEEKRYLPIVKNRIDNGSLSDIIRERVEKKIQRTDFKEAVVTVYSKLAESLMDNQPYT